MSSSDTTLTTSSCFKFALADINNLKLEKIYNQKGSNNKTC
jgi:hypothetical protein